MILYCLNRKEDVQDSKYAPRLLSNRIAFLQSSKKTQARIDDMACCNPSGKLGRSIARDQQNEHKVKTTKMLLRGLHSQLTDLTVEKATLGGNVLEAVESHDRQSMLLPEAGGRSSHRHLSEAQKMKVRGEIVRADPWNLSRDKVDFYDKPRGMFSGLTEEQINRFLIRNKAHHKRNSPHRMRMDEMMDVESQEKVGDNGGEDPLAEGEVGDGLCDLGGSTEGAVGGIALGSTVHDGSSQFSNVGGGSAQA
jgi:hypothetical protein